MSTFKEKLQDGSIAGIVKEQSKIYEKEGKQKGEAKGHTELRAILIEPFLRPAKSAQPRVKVGQAKATTCLTCANIGTRSGISLGPT